MSETQFALAWDQYKKSICSGLSTLQQNGEFVDMTLAADGHFVKVHQVIVALASPYIKELIASANCPHPIIFLNKISNTTLCSILEYIYTGEVLVTLENLEEFIDAARELHITGLEDMKSNQLMPHNLLSYQSKKITTADNTDEQICYFEVSSQRRMDDDQSELDFETTTLEDEDKNIKVMVQETYNEEIPDEAPDNYDIGLMDHEITTQQTDNALQNIDTKNVRVMQYTVSNQGSLQMILNRFVYYLKHSNRNNSRQWRCVDYLSNIKCPAHVVTKDDVVVQRIAAHTHPFHDKKILKKVRDGAVFTAIQEAEAEGTAKRKKNEEDAKIIGTE